MNYTYIVLTAIAAVFLGSAIVGCSRTNWLLTMAKKNLTRSLRLTKPTIESAMVPDLSYLTTRTAMSSKAL